jgi:3-oxoacyl-[acyl-carrier-protein] synthase-3
MDREAYRAGRHYYRLDAPAMHAQAGATLGQVTREVLERAGEGADRVALFVMHYLDARVARAAAETAGLPRDRIATTADAAGHLGAAGIPIALSEARATGRVRRGDLVCCAAFGAGVSWGGALLRL